MCSFDALNLDPELVKAVEDLGYTDPTTVQSQVIPAMLAGTDVIVRSKTGSGKTAAFSLPVIQNLVSGEKAVQCLVLTPTRELALQVSRAMIDYGKHSQVKVLAVYGGQHYGPQIRSLKKGVQVVVGTPGRLNDLIRKNILDLSSVHTVVLDEADEMLSMGFIEDIETILSETPSERQTTLFSATVPQRIRKLAEKYMNDPQSIFVQQKEMTVDTIEQRYCVVNEKDKLAVLTRFFEVEEISSALIFAKTRVSTGELANEMTMRGFAAEPLNGDLNQDARERVLNRFRKNQIKVLVATDVAARGLDIDDISHVFNYDLPHDPQSYVHRVGRTGRAGKTGIAITLVTPKEKYSIRRIEKFTRHQLVQAAIPTEEEIATYRVTQLMDQVAMWLRRGRCSQEQVLVEQLVEEGHDAQVIAAVALKIARGEEKQRPIAQVSEVREVQRGRSKRPNRAANRDGARGKGNVSHEAGMIRMRLNRGKHHGVRARDVVSTIARYSKVPGSSLGKIRIQEKNTLVDVPENYVEQVLAKSGAYQLHQQPIQISVAN
ncbi:MAG: DEAD/DEAH box helicase [Anaerolineaceae bacterium]|nr:DEAD/DEAH box helicase [Anaerolineaceae bacterium]